jgi:hypothetical protein
LIGRRSSTAQSCSNVLNPGQSALADIGIAITLWVARHGASTQSFGGYASIDCECFLPIQHASAFASEYSFFLVCHRSSPQYELTCFLHWSCNCGPWWRHKTFLARLGCPAWIAFVLFFPLNIKLSESPGP